MTTASSETTKSLQTSIQSEADDEPFNQIHRLTSSLSNLSLNKQECLSTTEESEESDVADGQNEGIFREVLDMKSKKGSSITPQERERRIIINPTTPDGSDSTPKNLVAEILPLQRISNSSLLTTSSHLEIPLTRRIFKSMTDITTETTNTPSATTSCASSSSSSSSPSTSILSQQNRSRAGRFIPTNALSLLCQDDDNHLQSERPGTNHKKRKVPSLNSHSHSALNKPTANHSPHRTLDRLASTGRSSSILTRTRAGFRESLSNAGRGEFDDAEEDDEDEDEIEVDDEYDDGDLPPENGDEDRRKLFGRQDAERVGVDQKREAKDSKPWTRILSLDYKDPEVLARGLCSRHIKLKKKSIDSPTHYGRHLHKLTLSRLISEHPDAQPNDLRTGPVTNHSSTQTTAKKSENPPTPSQSTGKKRNTKRKVPSQALLLKHKANSAQKNIVSSSFLKTPILPNLFDPKLAINFKYPKALNESDLIKSRAEVKRKLCKDPYWNSSRSTNLGLSRTRAEANSNPRLIDDRAWSGVGSSEFSFTMEIVEVNRRLEKLHSAISEERKIRELQIREAMRIAMEQERDEMMVEAGLESLQKGVYEEKLRNLRANRADLTPKSKFTELVSSNLSTQPQSNNKKSGSTATTKSGRGPSGPPPSEPPPPLPLKTSDSSSSSINKNDPASNQQPRKIDSDSEPLGQPTVVMSEPKKNKKKGKKKRSTHANANNIHHRDNYVPSRLPSASNHFQNQQIWEELNQMKNQLMNKQSNKPKKKDLDCENDEGGEEGEREEDEDEDGENDGCEDDDECENDGGGFFDEKNKKRSTSTKKSVTNTTSGGNGHEEGDFMSFEKLVRLNQLQQDERRRRNNRPRGNIFIDPNLNFFLNEEGDDDEEEDLERDEDELKAYSKSQKSLKGCRPSNGNSKNKTSNNSNNNKTNSIGSKGYSHSQLGRSIISRFIVEPDEWICGFCEYELWFGDEVGRIIKKRKEILRRRKKARDRALKATSGLNPNNNNSSSSQNNLNGVKGGSTGNGSNGNPSDGKSKSVGGSNGNSNINGSKNNLKQ